MKRIFKKLPLLASLLASGVASAGTFDGRGVFTFAPDAALRVGFEEPLAVAGASITSTPTALEGGSVLRIESGRRGVTFPLSLPEGQASYKGRLFVRNGRTAASITIAPKADATLLASEARFFPTGVVTSDGWYELETAPFSLDTATHAAVFVGGGSGTEVDALELIPTGTFVGQRSCSGPADASCGPGYQCAASLCQYVAGHVPPLPDAADRVALMDYLSARLTLFFGGRFTRANRLGVALTRIASLPTAKDNYSFWNGWAHGLRTLRDWHTRTNGSYTEGRGALPICVVEGDADVSRTGAGSIPGFPDVLVSHLGPEQNSGLAPGDQIVSVDGVHPLAWVESLEEWDWGAFRADDPNVHAEAAERLRTAIRRFATSFTVVRCDRSTGACAAPEVILVKDLPRTEPKLYPNCDHRPAYHLETGNPDETTHEVGDIYYGRLKDTRPEEGLYGMIWDYVYLDPSQTNSYEPAMSEFRKHAKGLVWDHRTGNGGTALAATYLTSLFRRPDTLAMYTGFIGTVGWFDGFTPERGRALYKDTRNLEAFEVGAADARVDLPVALLLARDGSASDWLPLGMKGVPNVRLFGRRTAGAFSSYFQFDYFGGFSWQFASGDLLMPDGTTHLGLGVMPDEEIVPRQSDLLRGKDTVYERALDWVRTYTECRPAVPSTAPATPTSEPQP